jgi:hypothetical protein
VGFDAKATPILSTRPDKPKRLEGTSVKRIFIGLVAALLAPVSHAKLIGADRDKFVRAVYETCYEANDARKKGSNLPDLARYCACYSNALADRMFPEQVERLNQTLDLRVLRPLAREAASACRRPLG